MINNKIIETYRIFFGLLIYISIFYQLYYLSGDLNYNLINYVSYFTVLSNLFVAAVLIFSGIRSNVHAKGYDMARGASTLYILITCLGFVFLLNGDNEQLLPWVNIVLHYISPSVMFLDWILVSTNEPLKFTEGLYWIIPALVYFGYSLIRGKIINWYPYEFLNLEKNTTGELFLYSYVVLMSSIMIIWFLITVQRVIMRK